MCLCMCVHAVCGCLMVVSDEFLPAFSVLGGSLCPWAEVVWEGGSNVGVSRSCVVLLTVSCLR